MGELFTLGGEKVDLGVVAQGAAVAAVMHTKFCRGRREIWSTDQKMAGI
jgi:hypothetical protein